MRELFILLVISTYQYVHGLQDKCVVSTCVEFNLYCTMLKHFRTSLNVICIICMLKHSPHLYSRFQITFHCNIPNFVAKFGSSFAKFKSSFQNSQASL